MPASVPSSYVDLLDAAIVTVDPVRINAVDLSALQPPDGAALTHPTPSSFAHRGTRTGLAGGRRAARRPPRG
jgi:hypothetical protein